MCICESERANHIYFRLVLFWTGYEKECKNNIKIAEFNKQA